MNIFEELEWRGLVADCTDPTDLQKRLESGPIVLYCGFDPTADSLHMGSLVPLLALRRFQLHGHHPIAVAGGATGMVGNPARLVDNADWTAPVGFLDFLRDIGKHFSVNQMMAKESVRARMEDRES